MFAARNVIACGFSTSTKISVRVASFPAAGNEWHTKTDTHCHYSSFHWDLYPLPGFLSSLRPPELLPKFNSRVLSLGIKCNQDVCICPPVYVPKNPFARLHSPVSIHLSLCQVYLSVLLLHVYVFMYLLSIRPIHLSINRLISPANIYIYTWSTHLQSNLHVCLSIYLSIYLSICLCFQFFCPSEQYLFIFLLFS